MATKKPDDSIQALGHQIGSLASVIVVALVQFGVPLTPGQQSSILSLIAVTWAIFATIYGQRHRMPTRNKETTTENTPPRGTPTHTR